VCAKAGLATARTTGVTEAGFCIATEDRPREGSSKVLAEGVGKGEGGVAVTEQRDEEQERQGRVMWGGRTVRTLETTD